MTGDGLVDVLMSCGDAGKEIVAVFPGVGDGTLGAPLTTVLSSYLDVIAGGDFDGDGHLDVVGAGLSTLVLRGDGQGGFVEVQVPSMGATPDELAIFDLDGDDVLDLLLSTLTDGEIEVLRGLGDATWTTTQVIPVEKPFGLAVVPDTSKGTPAVLAVTGGEAFASVAAFDVAPDGTLVPLQTFKEKDSKGFLIGQFDGNGRVDAMIVGSGESEVLLGDAPWLPPPQALPGVTSLYQSAAVGDVNEDGVDDAAIAYGEVRLFLSAP